MQPNEKTSWVVLYEDALIPRRRWSPSWISIFGHNFGVDQHFCTKFGTRMENQQSKVTNGQESRFRIPRWRTAAELK